MACSLKEKIRVKDREKKIKGKRTLSKNQYSEALKHG
jgi:hypothetical protein